jgi:FixJ family two-component response regulator
MDTRYILKDRVVLVVDDENDVTDTVEEVLDMCFVRKTGFSKNLKNQSSRANRAIADA